MSFVVFTHSLIFYDIYVVGRNSDGSTCFGEGYKLLIHLHKRARMSTGKTMGNTPYCTDLLSYYLR